MAAVKSKLRGTAKPGRRGTITLRVEMEPARYARVTRIAKRRKLTLRDTIEQALDALEAA